MKNLSLAVGLAALLGLAACGNDTADTTAPADAPPPAADPAAPAAPPAGG